MATLDRERFELHLPPRHMGAVLDQDEEWCEIEMQGERRRIRLHDYAAIYDVPGLYEQLFAEKLRCTSPEVVCDLLGEQLDDAGVRPATMGVLDFGAGNGMIGEQLDRIGFGTIVGIDLLPEARAAALRDRPDVYDDYRVLDLTALRSNERSALEAHDLDCLTCVAALGFGDVPQLAFAEAFNLVASPGWLAFNLRDKILEEEHPDGFGALIARMLAEGVVEERARRHYTHRVSIAGEPLDYVAIVATKVRDIPLDWVR
ncbi:MAG TPA: class I SAM-dependent methyltransferase [Solirubrobacteraceae bacterium]|nr:class I SAM-dependent methyltransferase [Solirubrobacteraceae bacterium]